MANENKPPDNGHDFAEWEEFSNYLRLENRHCLDEKQKNFVERIIKSASERVEEIPKDSTFWRARLGMDYSLKNNKISGGPLAANKMNAPVPGYCLEGRANPKGISYLYLSYEEGTAIAEIKPYIGAAITLCPYKLKEPVRVVNVSSDKDEKEKELWFAINMYYSMPIEPGDPFSDYAATQYLAALFKNKGFQGIAYGSAQKQGGRNLVLFYSNLVQPGSTKLMRCRDIIYSVFP